MEGVSMERGVGGGRVNGGGVPMRRGQQGDPFRLKAPLGGVSIWGGGGCYHWGQLKGVTIGEGGENGGWVKWGRGEGVA